MMQTEKNEDVVMTRVRISACKEFIYESVKSAEKLLQALKIIQMKLGELEIDPGRKHLIYEIKSQIATVEISSIQLKIYLKHFFEVFKKLEAEEADQ